MHWTVPLVVALFGCTGPGSEPTPPHDTGEADTDDTSPEPEDTGPCGGSGYTTWYLDADGDGFGEESEGVEACEAPSRVHVARTGDCDDGDADIHPGQHEDCATEYDDNCDGHSNWGAVLLGSERFYYDGDGDAYGLLEAEHQDLCKPETPYTGREVGDCDDEDPDVWPGQGGCLVLDDSVWIAAYHGFQETQRLGFHEEANEFSVTELTGDGIPDLVIGSVGYASAEDDCAGALFVVPGPLSGDVYLDDPGVFRLEGTIEDETEFLAYSLLTADLDGDGIDDIVARASGLASGGHNGVWIFDGARFLSEGMGAATTRIESSSAPYSVFANAGDVSSDLDGDGTVELILGDQSDDESANLAGAVYILEDLPSGRYDVTELYTAKLLGASSSDSAGKCVVDAGDTDGDGLGDVLVGATTAGPAHSGAAYLVRGPVTGVWSLADADAELLEEDPGGYGGCGLAGGGDADGDGLDDLLVGAYYHGGERGAAYLVLGGVEGGTSDLADAAEATVLGPDRAQHQNFWTGLSLAFLSTDGDTDALVIGSPPGGYLALVGGAVSYVAGPVSGVHVVGSVGTTLNSGTTDIGFGWNLAGAGDLDADGWEDLLVSAPGASPADTSEAGSLFLLPGAYLATAY